VSNFYKSFAGIEGGFHNHKDAALRFEFQYLLSPHIERKVSYNHNSVSGIYNPAYPKPLARSTHTEHQTKPCKACRQDKDDSADYN
jgi:hypothetical protein